MLVKSSSTLVDAHPKAKLSDKHREMLEVSSAISPDSIAGRGYSTIRSRAEVPQVFKKYQRRAPALLVPMYSPDGTSTLYQIRPDNPRRTGKGKHTKYETPAGAQVIADVHPHMMDAAKDASRSLFITEGVKCGDSLNSRGEVTVSITGVWNAQRKGKLLPCFDHIPLKGRLVFIVFDSDVMVKEGVQKALKRTVPLLEERGADVRVIYLPNNAEDGSKQGVDDYLANGGTVAQLKVLATRFEPESLTKVRLSKDKKLAAAIRELWRNYDAMPKKTQGQNTGRSVMQALIRAAQEHGNVGGGFVKVARSVRQIALDAAISHTAARKQLAKLEEQKVLQRNPPNKKGHAQELLLFVDSSASRVGGFHQDGSAQDAHKGRANGFHQGRTPDTYAAWEERANSFHDGDNPSLSPVAPPPGPPPLHNGNQMRAPRALVPELRWSTFVVHMEQSRFSGEWLEVREYVARLGKKRAAIVEYLARFGPEVAVSELMEEFAGENTRKRDFIRRNIAPLGVFGIATQVNGTVSLCDDWLRGVADAREVGGEQVQTRLQEERYRRQREAYKNRHAVRPEPVPEPPQVDDMSKPWSHHAEDCACRECESRFGKVIGAHVEECQCSECRAVRDGKAPKPRRTALKLVTPSEVSEESEATPEPPKRPGWHDHPMLCECDGCLYPEPKYARPWKGAS